MAPSRSASVAGESNRTPEAVAARSLAGTRRAGFRLALSSTSR